MSRPTVAQLRPVANPVLTNMLIAYMNDDSDYVARRAAPVVPVNEESGTYVTFPKGFWFADTLERRAYGDKYARGGYEVGSDTYKTLQWGLEHPIPDEHRATSQVPLSLEQTGLSWLANQSNIRKERAFAADFMTTGVWTTDDTSTTDWDDASGAPVADVQTAKRSIRQVIGRPGNAMVCGEIVYDALLVNAEVEGKLQYTTQMTIATVAGILASVLGLEFLFVGSAQYNSANLGQTASLSPIIDDDALVFVLDPGADMMSVSAMKTFTWAPGGGEGQASVYRDEESDSDIVKHKEQWDQKLVTADAGYFFSDVV